MSNQAAALKMPGLVIVPNSPMFLFFAAAETTTHAAVFLVINMI